MISSLLILRAKIKIAELKNWIQTDFDAIDAFNSPYVWCFSKLAHFSIALFSSISIKDITVPIIIGIRVCYIELS